MNNQKQSKSTGRSVLNILAIVGVLLIIYRLIRGLGASTNLSDGYPWGLWIGIDIMAGIAMTTGGLIIAVLVLIFGKSKFRPLLKPALLTAFLGYILEIIGLVPDLGRPWMLWSTIINWNNDSAMFLVAWCVIFQAIFLFTILAPTIFEKFKWKAIQNAYDIFVPWVGIFLITFFVYLVSGALIWTGITFVLFIILWIIFKTSVKKDSILLLLAVMGIIISVSHQTALGTLFVLIPEKLAGLWYTPFLQINFLITSIALGLAMIILESTLSSKAFGFGLETNLITSIGKGLLWVLFISIIIRFVTLFDQTGFDFSEAGTGPQIFSFILEILVGLLIPFILLLSPAKRNSAKALYNVAIFVIIGMMINRINVAWVGINSVGYNNYVPYFIEILVTLGIFSIGIISFYTISRRFAIFSEH
ncbi:MAG: NrfD/PsrC family molybdoenzyme membrane anchor subunit [Bacteroidota bacterium]